MYDSNRGSENKEKKGRETQTQYINKTLNSKPYISESDIPGFHRHISDLTRADEKLS